MTGKNMWISGMWASGTVEHLLMHVNERSIDIPIFQRRAVWSEGGCQDFIADVRKQGEVEMPLAFYTIKGEERGWVADGRQRIYALQQAAKDPDMAEEFKRIIVGARVFKDLPDHEAAHGLFIRLNKGLVLTHYDRFKGEFTGFNQDRACEDRDDFYQELYRSVCDIIPPLSTGNKEKKPTPTSSVCRRDSLIMWARFNGCDVELNPSAGNPRLEKVVRAFYDKQKDPRNISKFKDEISKAYETANTIYLKALTGADSKHDILEQKFASVVIGAYLLKKQTTAEWVGTLETLAQYIADGRERSGYTESQRLEVIKPSQEIHYPDTRGQLVLKSGSIKVWERLAENFPPSPKRSRQKLPASRGRHNGHVKPFSTHGDGEVVSEPAILNQVNGAKPMSDDDVKAYRARVEPQEGAV